MIVFFDTNVLLDVLGRREPFYEDSARVWTLSEIGRIESFISILSLPYLFYLLGRGRGQKEARKTMGILRDVFSMTPLDAQRAHQAIDSDIADFEDALQFFSALRARADVIVTRNPRDFPQQPVAIQIQTQFLATHFSR